MMLMVIPESNQNILNSKCVITKLQDLLQCNVITSYKARFTTHAGIAHYLVAFYVLLSLVLDAECWGRLLGQIP